MEKIHVLARFKIHKGKLEDFKLGASRCIDVTKEEHGALLYDWFIDEEAMECTVVETYADSTATLHHASNINESLSQLMEIADFSGEVFGNKSEELATALGQMNIKAIPYYGGM